MNKIVKKILNVLFYVLLILIFVGSVLFARNTNENKSIFGYRFYEVLSGSMRPTIKIGELVIIKMADPQSIEVGDIVTRSLADDGSTTLTHRVIDIFTDDKGVLMFQTQGDNNPQPDQPIRAEQVIGIVTAHIPVVGYVIGYIKNHIVLSLIYLILFLIIVYSLKYLLKKTPEESKDLTSLEIPENQTKMIKKEGQVSIDVGIETGEKE